MNGWIFFWLFVALLGVAVFAIWFNKMLEDYYTRKDELERREVARQTQENEPQGIDWGDYDPTDKLEPMEVAREKYFKGLCSATSNSINEAFDTEINEQISELEPRE